MSEAVSAAMVSTEYGPGGAVDGGMPRLSKVITWYPSATPWATMPIAPQLSARWPVPHTNTSGSPAPWTS